jgi:hypothetical protein
MAAAAWPVAQAAVNRINSKGMARMAEDPFHHFTQGQVARRFGRSCDRGVSNPGLKARIVDFARQQGLTA